MTREFRRQGLGYVMADYALALEVGVRRLSRSRGELHGEIDVSCGLGTRSADGRLHKARFNLSSTSARNTLARALTSRAPVPDLDWSDVLEDFCRQVMAAEEAGEPVVMVGSRPRPVARPYRIDPLMPIDEPVTLYGEGGTGKSTLAAALAVSVETGVAVVPGFVPRRAPVLYLDWESGPDAINERVALVATGANIPDPVQIRYRAMSRPLADGAEDLAAIVAEEGIGLVVVDSVGLAAGIGDGSDAAETAWRLFGAFRILRTSVLCIDHIAKSNADEPGKASRPYGSIYKTNLARATFELRRLDGADGATLGLYCTKYNDRAKLPPIALAVHHGDDAIRYERLDELPDDLTKPLGLAERMASVMAFQALESSDIAELVGSTPAVVREYLRRGQKAGRFSRQPTSGRWEVVGKEASRAEVSA